MALLTSTTTTAVRDPSAASFGDEKASVFTNSTTEYAIHALRKDEDGLLYYTKVKLNSNDEIQMGTKLAYSGLSDIVLNQFKDGTPVNDTNPTIGESGLEQHETNKINRYWNQTSMKMDKYQYFINSDGNFVMRFLGTDYNYVAQDGATGNWIKA